MTLSPAVFFLLSYLSRYDPAMPFAFEKLEVYQKAVDLADEIAAK